MTVLKERLNRKNSLGTYDTIYLETSSAVVIMADGKTLEATITAMNTAIGGKAAASHGTHVTFSTTAPAMNGTAAVGTATTVSRSDHVHPTDTSRAASSHNHAAGNITSGTLAIARGGTGLTASPSMLTNLASTTAANVLVASPRPGVTGTLPLGNGGTGKTTAPLALYALVNGSTAITTLADGDYIPVADVSATTGKKITVANLRSAVGASAPSGVTVPTYPSSIPAVGSTFSWAGYTWRVVHKANGIAWCVTDTLPGTVQWAANNYADEYFGSLLHMKMVEFGLTTGIQFCDFVADFGAGKVFAPSYDQCNGAFSYFATQANRIAKNSAGTATAWWTCTGYGGNDDRAWSVDTGGTLSSNYRTVTSGFRPCVALQT